MTSSVDVNSLIIWSDNPEKEYFAYVLELEKKKRLVEEKDEESAISWSTQEELLFDHQGKPSDPKQAEASNSAIEQKEVTLKKQSATTKDMKKPQTPKTVRFDDDEESLSVHCVNQSKIIPPFVYVIERDNRVIKYKSKSKVESKRTVSQADRDWKGCIAIIVLAIILVLLSSILVASLLLIHQKNDFVETIPVVVESQPPVRSSANYRRKSNLNNRESTKVPSHTNTTIFIPDTESPLNTSGNAQGFHQESNTGDSSKLPFVSQSEARSTHHPSHSVPPSLSEAQTSQPQTGDRIESAIHRSSSVISGFLSWLSEDGWTAVNCIC